MMILLLACATEAPSTPPPAPAPPPAAPETPATTGPTVPTLLGDVPGVAFVGDWTSPSCGGRSFARNLHFDEDQQYAVIDLVSPCPTGTTCSWSGLVTYAGTWVQLDQEVQLREIGSPASADSPHPRKIQATTDGRLVEPEAGCFYERGLTIPEGYAAERVTPKVPR